MTTPKVAIKFCTVDVKNGVTTIFEKSAFITGVNSPTNVNVVVYQGGTAGWVPHTSQPYFEVGAVGQPTNDGATFVQEG